MNGHEFKPGDVAVIPFARGPVLAMMTVRGWSLETLGYGEIPVVRVLSEGVQ